MFIKIIIWPYIYHFQWKLSPGEVKILKEGSFKVDVSSAEKNAPPLVAFFLLLWVDPSLPL